MLQELSRGFKRVCKKFSGTFEEFLDQMNLQFIIESVSSFFFIDFRRLKRTSGGFKVAPWAIKEVPRSVRSIVGRLHNGFPGIQGIVVGFWSFDVALEGSLEI